MASKWDVLINEDDDLCLARTPDGDDPLPVSLSVRDGRLYGLDERARPLPIGMLTPEAEARLSRETAVVVIDVDAGARLLGSAVLSLTAA
jgi:hypothetical protein